jgi:hypothetical protein
MLIMAGSGNDTHSWITTIAALGRVGYRAEMRSRRANAELPKWGQTIRQTWAAPAGGRKSRIWRTACQSAIQHSTAHNPHCGGRGLFFKGLLHNRERILQVSSVNDVPLFPNK